MKMAKRRCQQRSESSSREQKEVRLEFPDGDPDLEALRSVTREWLVPRLIEKFLLAHGVELRASSAAVHSLRDQYSRRRPTTSHLSKGDAE